MLFMINIESLYYVYIYHLTQANEANRILSVVLSISFNVYFFLLVMGYAYYV